MTNNRNYYTTPSNYVDHTRFGGKIYNFDYEGYNSMSDIVSRIISDWKFDEKCRKNVKNRDESKNYKKGNN